MWLSAPRTQGGLLLVALVMCGWWAAGLEPFSTRATWIVLGAGLLSMVVGRATRGVAPGRDAPLRTAAPWLLPVGALAALQLTAFVQHPRSDHPTLSSLVNTALDPRPVRALAFAAWLLAAGWLARR